MQAEGALALRDQRGRAAHVDRRRFHGDVRIAGLELAQGQEADDDQDGDDREDRQQLRLPGGAPVQSKHASILARLT